MAADQMLGYVLLLKSCPFHNVNFFSEGYTVKYFFLNWTANFQSQGKLKDIVSLYTLTNMISETKKR